MIKISIITRASIYFIKYYVNLYGLDENKNMSNRIHCDVYRQGIINNKCINMITMHKELFVPVNIWREMTLILISKNMFPRGGYYKNTFRSCLQTCCIVRCPLPPIRRFVTLVNTFYNNNNNNYCL